MAKSGVPAWRAAAALALPLLYMAVIYSFSAMPADSLQQVAVSDKLLHTIEYAGLSVMLYIGLRFGVGWQASRVAWLAVIISVLFGFSDEWHQSFVPGRDPSVLDITADAVGAVLAQAGLWVLRIGRHRLMRTV